MQPTSLDKFLLVLTFASQVTSQCTYNATKSKVGTIGCGEPAEDVEGIFIPWGSVSEIKKGLFDSFPKLNSITMIGLNIQNLEPRAFDGLKLKYLKLNNNNLKNIEHGTFNSLNTTTFLEVASNQIETLGPNIFLWMTSLSWISLSGNKIKTVDRAAFNGLGNLKYLHMIYNKIELLELGTFDSLASLKFLDLSVNSLTEIKLGLFARLRELERLVLNQNKLESLPDYIFSNLTAIQEIDLSENKLLQLQDNLFYGIENLQKLKFNSNNVRQFHSKSILVRVPKLKEVELYGNPWKCEELEKIRRDFQAKNVVSPIPVPVQDSPNVEGVGCSE